MHALDPLFSSKSSNLYKWLNDFYRLLFSFRPYDTTTSSLNTYLSSEHLFSLKVLKPPVFWHHKQKIQNYFYDYDSSLSIYLSLSPPLFLLSGAATGFWLGWGAKDFDAREFFLAPHSKLANRCECWNLSQENTETVNYFIHEKV